MLILRGVSLPTTKCDESGHPLKQVPALPATLCELTLHGGASGLPFKIEHLTQLERLVLVGSAYLGLDVCKSPADSANTAAPLQLLPASLRTLQLQQCSNAANALRVLSHPRLGPPPAAVLSLHTNDTTALQWPVYLDASPRPPPDDSDRGARLPAGFAALQLRIPRISLRVRYDLGSVPEAPPDASELLCRMFSAAPDSYLQFSVFVPAGGLVVGASGELIRKTAYHQAPAVPGDTEQRFSNAEALAKRAWSCSRQLGLRSGTATIDGEECVVVSRQAP